MHDGITCHGSKTYDGSWQWSYSKVDCNDCVVDGYCVCPWFTLELSHDMTAS